MFGGYNRTHLRSYRAHKSCNIPLDEEKAQKFYGKPVYDSKIPCAFMCHVIGGGVMSPSAWTKKAPRRGGFKIITETICADVLEAMLLETFIPFCLEYEIKLLICDCGCKLHQPRIQRVLKDYHIDVYPKGKDFVGGYPAYAPMCMPLDEIIFPNYSNLVSKFMKTYDSRRTKSTLQYVMYRAMIRIWNSDQIQNLCKIAIPHMAKVYKQISDKKRI